MSSSAKSNVVSVLSETDFKKIVDQDTAKNDVFALYFWASWAEPCIQMKEVFQTLSGLYPQIKFLEIEAEELPDLSESFEIESVPSFVFIKNNKILSKINGANASELTATTEKYAKALGALVKPKSEPVVDLNTKLKQLINQESVMIFIKGNPRQPRCGFSRQLIEILSEQKVKYGHFDILSDDEVRQGLKKFSNWPTYPQVYIKGELTGGLDIIRELIDEDEFQSLLPSDCKNFETN